MVYDRPMVKLQDNQQAESEKKTIRTQIMHCCGRQTTSESAACIYTYS